MLVSIPTTVRLCQIIHLERIKRQEHDNEALLSRLNHNVSEALWRTFRHGRNYEYTTVSVRQQH